MVKIYTDGSNVYNGKPYSYGGYGYVIINEDNSQFCPEYTTGIIYLTGLSCTSGYLNQSLNEKADFATTNQQLSQLIGKHDAR